MLNDDDMGNLIADMRTWGVTRVRRIVLLADRHGILMSEDQYSDGKRG